MARAFIVLPNPLVKSLPSNTFDLNILAENCRLFSDFRFHEKKLFFHRASMKYYQHLLKKERYRVSYINHKSLFQRPSSKSGSHTRLR